MTSHIRNKKKDNNKWIDYFKLYEEAIAMGFHDIRKDNGILDTGKERLERASWKHHIAAMFPDLYIDTQIHKAATKSYNKRKKKGGELQWIRSDFPKDWN